MKKKIDDLMSILTSLPTNSRLKVEMEACDVKRRSRKLVKARGIIDVKPASVQKLARKGSIVLEHNSREVLHADVDLDKNEIKVNRANVLWFLSRPTLIIKMLRLRRLLKSAENNKYRLKIDKHVFTSIFSTKSKHESKQHEKQY